MEAKTNDQATAKAHYNFGEPIKELRPEAKELLLDYAGVPESEALAHVHRMRDKAWETCPYGCVGLFVFIFPTIPRLDILPTQSYEDLVESLKSGKKFLDLGCGFGQNIRKLVHDGAPSENLAGADISAKFVEYGYEYFRDEGKLRSRFIIGDVLDEASTAFLEAERSFDIVFASMFYHLWGWDDHIKTLIRTTKLLKPIAGSQLLGWQLGATPAAEITRNLYPNRLEQHKLMYLHDEDSWKKMWKSIEAQTRTKWNVQVKAVVTPEIQERLKTMGAEREDLTMVALFFSMTRVE